VVINKKVLTFPELCHSCGGCMAICPEGAIAETGRELGVMEIGAVDGIGFVHGRLRVGEAMAPPLIRHVRACTRSDGLTLIDAPPGTSCPVIAAMKGADFVLLVTEPTPFGLHDLRLALELVRKLGLPCGVIVNRDAEVGDPVGELCARQEVEILARLPFRRRVAEVCAEGGLALDADPDFATALGAVADRLTRGEVPA
jgi:MinD superfamily P-loop ATPase